MNKNRLEAFSDGVIAIIITIMVLELHAPEGVTLADLMPEMPILLSYVLSFIYVGIYWNNHHHMLHASRNVNGRVLWANLHLLFWLSLIPFTTRWMGHNALAPDPIALYGSVLFMAALAYHILARTLISLHGRTSPIGKALGRDYKGIASMLMYALAVALSRIDGWISLVLYVTVAFMWFVPDRRIEKTLKE